MKQLITGRDGRVRAAILAVPSGQGQTSTLQRPIQLLYPLETGVKTSTGNRVAEGGTAVLSPTPSENEVPEENQNSPDEIQVRPKRAVVLRANEQLRELDN